jgi:RTX calcium-binding nonapeptide repeat (4 copies)
VLTSSRVLAFVAAAGVAASLAGASWARNIVGSPESDLLRGSGKADQIYGRGGADWIFGGGGDDALLGGAGDDTISGGQGNDDVICGPGKDTVIADVGDSVAPDCEVVLRSPPPPDTPPPASPPVSSVPVLPGRYSGATQNGDLLFFEVLADGHVTRFRVNAVNLACDVPPLPPPATEESAQPEPADTTFGVYHVLDFGDSQFSVDRLGSFSITGRANGNINGSPSRYTFSLKGEFSGGLAAGAMLIDESFDDGKQHTCSSSEIWWTAARLQ